jgi:cyclopropane-fatty-acyl-phospholipid synthase
MADRFLKNAGEIFRHVGERIDSPFSVELWDGSVIPLGPHANPNFRIRINGSGVIGAILRRPNLETVLRQYATGGIDFAGTDLLTFIELGRARKVRLKPSQFRKIYLILRLLPFLAAKGEKAAPASAYAGDETGAGRARDDSGYIRFHYDLGNDFYALFLDPEMQYSCAYFRDWQNSLEIAQHDKLDMICRKLRLQPGERFLDIGSGWGGLLCHAAKNYGVTAHGVTLSEAQFAFTQAKVKALGLEDRVTVELKSYEALDGEFDKIASIGMVEHVGIANYPVYFGKLNGLLRDRGILLNHGITRRAKASRRGFKRIGPERRLILKYVFPGSELDAIGHSLAAMEAAGFEIHDVEGWREHYARTCRLWHQRLVANEAKAVALVGREKYRIWIAYLAGVSFAFADGSLRIYQTVATKHRGKGASGMPPTREHLYR